MVFTVWFPAKFTYANISVAVPFGSFACKTTSENIVVLRIALFSRSSQVLYA